MTKAIVGHTGFVGGNLIEQMDFDSFYNSKNINDIKGRAFDLLVLSGVSAVKWQANKEPQQDWQKIEGLINCLKEAKAKKVVLISTVDVYKQPINVTENTRIELNDLHPYGLHRFKFEEFVKSNFADVTTIRLPGLFGNGLKKNIIFDYLTNNNVANIDTRHSFQFYNLANLARDIQRAIEIKLDLLNIAVEPVTVKEVAEACLGQSIDNHVAGTLISYDFKSIHDEKWAHKDGYLYSKEECLKDIKNFCRDFTYAQ